ncbi:uncharacterized protein Z519_04994 [Cladophialophora bantiana CBS 173.52]|uniref:Uncharacterized protein n=1 Tax=Cladophialophora bantiana (strain ATCC 10958 / CBS 173.52 / CDC B-1940 / NIH 8579) TaxID=1442370 RepID=A0A0D2IE35_CLAB1|nr:uncharacterized protein Z519_04994 [Cladophialophora bantiana CBS 173.52]KIW95014.1 hypothetical protein Z519_04994 [Cladophialophora bantiana CBS 173.52]
MAIIGVLSTWRIICEALNAIQVGHDDVHQNDIVLDPFLYLINHPKTARHNVKDAFGAFEPLRIDPATRWVIFSQENTCRSFPQRRMILTLTIPGYEGPGWLGAIDIIAADLKETLVGQFKITATQIPR